MRPAGVPMWRLLSTAAIVSIPALLVLGWLAVAGTISIGAAILAWLTVVAGLAVVVWIGLADLQAIRAYLVALARRGEAPAPRTTLALGQELVGAAGRLSRAMARQSERLTIQARANAALLDSVPEPLLALDSEQQVTSANLAARTLVGRSAVGRPLATVIRDPDVLEAARRTLEGAAENVVEFRYPGTVERTFLARFQRLAEPAPDGSVAIFTLQDLTAIKRTEQMRADFVANASHELRTPLSSLIGFIETMRGPASDDEAAARQFLDTMHEQATRMSRVVGDLMSLSRIEMDEHTPPTGRVDVGAVISSVVDALRLAAEAKGVRFDVALPETAAVVVGDEHQLTQVIQNLIDNAIKYCHRDSAIRIEVSHRSASLIAAEAPVPGGGTVVIAVSDESDGIPPEHLPRLTERFYRVDPGRSRRLGGTGLGLAIVKHIVNRHRGKFGVESTVGQGSTFTVRLPSAP